MLCELINCRNVKIFSLFLSSFLLNSYLFCWSQQCVEFVVYSIYSMKDDRNLDCNDSPNYQDCIKFFVFTRIILLLKVHKFNTDMLHNEMLRLDLVFSSDFICINCMIQFNRTSNCCKNRLSNNSLDTTYNTVGVTNTNDEIDGGKLIYTRKWLIT